MIKTSPRGFPVITEFGNCSGEAARERRTLPSRNLKGHRSKLGKLEELKTSPEAWRGNMLGLVGAVFPQTEGCAITSCRSWALALLISRESTQIVPNRSEPT